ncbi:dTMP kinase [Paenibacillus polymyxa]|uniref:dTMP kinase n=1 Tax=Paenibacillus polymyxa TaxID=1406 RepID=UPI001BE74067|nr:dTMP kinase [Paenibacillus polymyxa]MBT2284118.1 dTMP kinase [Paenibacillus polymyxa]
MFPALSPITKEYQGRLFVFDGVDGAGKTTMIEMLADKFRNEGKEVLITMQPTPEMRQLHIFKTFIYEPDKRHLVDYNALQMYMIADRLQHYKEVIEPALREGVYVISDRYIFTMLATMVARGNSPEPWLEEILPSIHQPHASFLMDVDLETSIARIKQRKSFEDSYVEREHLEKSLTSYRSVGECYNMHVISSADLGIEDAFSRIASIVGQLEVSNY